MRFELSKVSIVSIMSLDAFTVCLAYFFILLSKSFEVFLAALVFIEKSLDVNLSLNEVNNGLKDLLFDDCSALPV